MSVRVVIIVITVFVSRMLHAQMIDNTLSFRDMGSDSYFRFSYENDFFAAKDQYYTQGFMLELVAPSFKGLSLSKLLLHGRNMSRRYGAGFEHNGFTPADLGASGIVRNDRPFSAVFAMQTFGINIDTAGHQRLTATIHTGVIGPAAGGAEMQTTIHNWLHNITPHGWHNQVSNDIVINYRVGYQKEVFAYKEYVSLSADASAHAGTLMDKAGIGGTLMLGYFDPPYGGKVSDGKKFRVYVYEHPEVNVIGYDATLQGGLLNRASPYVLTGKDIERVVFQNLFGAAVSYKRMRIEYSRSITGKEYKSGVAHPWGGVQVAFGI